MDNNKQQTIKISRNVVASYDSNRGKGGRHLGEREKDDVVLELEVASNS